MYNHNKVCEYIKIHYCLLRWLPSQSREKCTLFWLLVGINPGFLMWVGQSVYTKSPPIYCRMISPFAVEDWGLPTFPGVKDKVSPLKYLSRSIDMRISSGSHAPHPTPPHPLASGVHTRSGAAIYSSVYCTIPQLFDISSSRPQINLSLLIRNFYAFSKNLELEGPH